MPSTPAGWASAWPPPGPGGIHLLNGLYDAKCDGQPVLAITGHTFHDLISTHYQQDVDLDKLFMDVAVYNERVMGPAHVVNVVDEAIKTALARRSVAHITIPKDIQDGRRRTCRARRANIAEAQRRSVRRRVRRCRPAHALQQAADLINRGIESRDPGRPRLPGRARGSSGAGREGRRADHQAAARQGGRARRQPVHDRRHRAARARRPRRTRMQECDTLIIAGSSFPYMEFYPKPGKAKCVQIDIDPDADRPALSGRRRAGRRLPRRACKRLLPLIERKDDRSFLEKAQEADEAAGTS